MKRRPLFIFTTLFLFSIAFFFVRCGQETKHPPVVAPPANISINLSGQKGKYVTGDNVVLQIALVDATKDTKIKTSSILIL